MNDLMINVIALVIDSIIMAALGGVVTYVSMQAKKIKAESKGIQALLRNELYKLYNECIKKGFATTEEKNNFENMYIQYHNLGQNGVMDNYRDRFMNLPDNKEVKKNVKKVIKNIA